MQSIAKFAAICIGQVILTSGLALAQTQELAPNKPLVMYPFPSAEFWHAMTIIAGLVFVAIGFLKKRVLAAWPDHYAHMARRTDSPLDCLALLYSVGSSDALSRNKGQILGRFRTKRF
jgi:hypothetical protein